MYKAEKLLKINNSKIPLGLIVSMIHRTRMMYLNDRVGDMDITPGQFPFIMVLSNEEGITQEELAAHFHIDKGTVARALRKLEDKNYLFRKVDSKNRRRYFIYLTDKGKRTVPKITNIEQEWENSICSKFSEEEYSRLFEILKILAINSLEKVNRNGENKK
ncbi:MarR family winged helix-turn-helix transcriptional regulator [Methanobacterium sp. SMA-27]|jgi:MarR family transcriptional regulator, temperature-dependent positive regulator of motility|uniref:MarR family winged helix-turn-helix transcriptional regulator n=1 Tax=Methanobacterium sp. SMA-27 TaxID=1495336 RepID=UPI00064E4526|nr:MarR family transcriptional regulator [Methanobacterium sp. SMA-27]